MKLTGDKLWPIWEKEIEETLVASCYYDVYTQSFLVSLGRNNRYISRYFKQTKSASQLINDIDMQTSLDMLEELVKEWKNELQ